MILQNGYFFLNLMHLYQWRIEYNPIEQVFEFLGTLPNEEEVIFCFWEIPQEEEDKALEFILSHFHSAVASDEKIINLDYLYSLYKS